MVAKVVGVQQHPYRDRRSGRQAYRLEVVVATAGSQLRLTFFDSPGAPGRLAAQGHPPGGCRATSPAGSAPSGGAAGQLTNSAPRRSFGEPARTAARTAGRRDATAAAAWEQLPQVLPIYPATSTLQSWQLAETIALALDLVHEVPELLPERVRAEHGFVSGRAGAGGHPPPATSWAQMERAAQRLRFDEAFVTQTVLAQRRAGAARRWTPSPAPAARAGCWTASTSGCRSR